MNDDALTVTPASQLRKQAEPVAGCAISIVIPIFNEARCIQNFLKHLREHAPGAEVIVVDGGSLDDSVEQATGWCDRLVEISVANRAAQLNAGARAATGDILWFLHADTQIPPDALDAISTALSNRHVVGGFFRIRIPQGRIIYRLTDGFAHYAGLASNIRCGDHGLFCRRNTFKMVGGYPNVNLMEDADFFRRLHVAGHIAVIRSRLITSPRRFEVIGPYRLTFFFGIIGLLYFFRVPRRILEAVYRRTCCRS
jgi:rSAM/selenodomain-associated transferase 2